MNLRPKVTHHPHTNEQAYNEIMGLTYKERTALLALYKYQSHYLAEHTMIILGKYATHLRHKELKLRAKSARKQILGKDSIKRLTKVDTMFADYQGGK